MNTKIIFAGIILLIPILAIGQTAGPGGIQTSTNNIYRLRSDKGTTIDGSNNLTTWSDQSNSNDAANINTPTNPLFDASASVGTNAEPAILFASASSEFLSISDNASINTSVITARTFYIVFQTGSDITTQQYLYQQGNGTDGIFAYVQAGNLTMGINSSSSSYTISSAALSASTAYIAGFTYDGGSGTLDLTVNGTGSTQVTSVAASIASHTTIRIGSDATNANFYNGHLAELIYFDVILNAGEHRMLNNYLGEKYGITLANDHFSTAGASYRYELTGISRVSTAEHNTSTGNGGTLYISENTADALSDDEHVLLGHNNDNLSTTSIDMAGIANTDRYNRIWYVEKTGNLGAIIEFDIVESGLYESVGGLTATDFSLLTRAGTSGDFSEVTTATTETFNGNRIQFTLTDGEYASGYYTLGSPSSPKRWYVINSGNWSDPNTWTLDPAGAIFNNPDNLTPDTSPTSASDEVFVLSGKSVTVGNGDMSGTLTKLVVDGTMDFGSSTGHGTVSLLEGSGTIRLSDDILPTFTDATHFTSAGPGAGTIEYYGGADVDLNSSSGLTTFYNLILDFDAQADAWVVTTDFTVNGTMTVTTGTFQINDDTETTRLVIDLNGDLNVSANGEISVGTGALTLPTVASNYHDAFHRINISGDFTNNGTVNFSNLTGYQFDAFPTNGDCVTVRFTGQSDNTLTCNSTTNFYDLVIDKGADKTYMLTVSASAIENFRIFGRNNLGNDERTANPILAKPLYINNGTLHLTGSIFIPSLTEGDDESGTPDVSNDGISMDGDYGAWMIPATGKLWIDGANVTVWGTTGDPQDVADIDPGLAVGNVIGVRTQTSQEQSVVVIGEFQITDGSYEAREGRSFYYSEDGPSNIIIEGGSMAIVQLRRAAGSGTANPVWFQSGGTVTILGQTQGGATDIGSVGVFDYVASDGVFIMSGGTISILDYNDNAEGDGGVTNGLNINVPVGNFNVTGGTIEIDLSASAANVIEPFEIEFTPNFYNLNLVNDGGDGFTFFTELDVNNDLIISSGTSTDLNGNDLLIGRNFNVEATAVFDRDDATLSNTTYFDGDASQTITLSGTITDDFHNIVFSGTGTKTIAGGNLTAINSLTISSGTTVDDGGQTIFVENAMVNSGTHQSSTGGEIEFSGGSGTYTVTGDDTGIFGNINLNDASNDVQFNNDMAIEGTLTFSQNQLLDIDVNKLRMQGASAAISGTSTFPTGNRYILTAGNASDGGLEMYLDGNETLTFPIGCDGLASARYSPVTAVFDTYVDDGYVRISIADEILPSTDPGAGDILSYYWVVDHSDFDPGDEPNVSSYTFNYPSSDEDEDGNNPNGSWRCGKVLNDSPYTRSIENNFTDGASNSIIFNAGFDVERASYSAGAQNRFNGTPTIYYSVTDGTWNDADTWSFSSGGAGGDGPPTEGSVVIIENDGAGDGHRVNVVAATNDVARVVFTHDYVNTPTPDSETVPRLQFLTALTHELGFVTGTGMVSFDQSAGPTVNGDFGEFGTNTESYYLYFGDDATLNSIPTPVPNLLMESWTFDIDQAITTNGSLIIQGNGSATPLQDITISNDLIIGTWVGGTFQFPDQATAVTLTVNGNIDFTVDPFTAPADRDFIVEDLGTNNVEHTLILGGDILHGAENGHSLDLYNGDAVSSRAVLELQGTSNNSYSRTSTSVPDLYSVVMNKGTSQTNTFSFDDDVTISAPTASVQTIDIQNGTLVLNDTDINFTLTNGTNATDFDIPSTGALQISNGTATITGDNVGITLDGSIILDGSGILDMDGGNNNYIEYSSSGSASIALSGTAQLLVGSQIRESSVTSGGILSYSQAGTSTAVLGTSTGGTPDTTEPILAVEGTGSSFNFTGGSITISNHLATNSIPSLLLDPATSSVTVGTNIQFGDASTTATDEDMSIQSTISLYDIALDNTSGNNPSLTLLNAALTVDNDLTIASNSTFDASGLDLTISGDFSNSGTFTANANETIFNGSGTQTITGNGTTFYDLSKTGANTVQLAGGSAIAVANNFNITAGTFDDNSNAITVSGIMNNTATHTNSSGPSGTSGIIMAGSTAQDITGAGTYSRLEINNSSGVSLNANIIVTEEVGLNAGVLDIQGFQLTMNENASFADVSGGGFNSSKMIQTRRSFTDAGVIKVFNGTGASPFTYPIGSGDKYTPMVLTLTQNSETAATIAVRAADEPHPNVQEDVDVPEFVDVDNVLQYYWEVTSSGMTDFTGTLTFTYEGSDAYVTSPFDLNDYQIARLLPDASDNWNKLSTGFNYQSRDGSNTLSFDISSASDDTEIGGDYTAGVDEAIPDQVQTVTSNVMGGTGNWSTDASWDTNSAPRGAIVDILAGDEIVMDVDNLLAYRSIIDGTLNVNGTSNQRLGRVSGTGTLIISGSGNLPAGIYDDFFNCSTGGTLAFNDTDNYTLPDEIANIRNLVLMGGGIKSFPNTDITICNDIELQDGVTLNNDFNIDVDVLGNVTLTNGTFDLGSNATYNVSGDATITAGAINLNNSDLIVSGDLTVNGGALNLGTNGSLDIDGDLIIAGGTLNGANSSNINVSGNITFSSGTVAVNATTTTIVLDGTGSQTISGDFTGTASFNNLTLNKATGSASIVDGGNDVEIDGTLTLTSGNISTDATNTLTINSGGNISGGSSSSYVVGPLIKNDIAASGSFTFHIGISSRYGYVTIGNVGTGGRNWTAEYSSSNPNSGQTIDVTTNAGFGSMVEIAGNSLWTITPSASSTASVELGIITGMGVQEINNVRVAIYNGPTASEWVNLGGSPSGTETNGSITTQTDSDFSSSSFSIGGITNTALPVTLLSFTGTVEDDQINLDWSTASEADNDYFEIEKSHDGISYQIIGTVAGNGNSNEIIEYNFLDDDPNIGANYYRLVQHDFDGAYQVYGPILVNYEPKGNPLDISFYPNPTNHHGINLAVKSESNLNIELVLYDLNGQMSHYQVFDSSTLFRSHFVKFNVNLPSGIYQAVVRQGKYLRYEKIIIN